MRLAARILWTPLVILVVLFIVLGLFVARQISVNSSDVMQRGLENLISIHSNELRTSLQLITSSTLPADAFVGLEVLDDGLALDLLKQVKPLMLDATLIMELDGTLIYPGKAPVPSGLDKVLRSVDSSTNTAYAKLMGNTLVAYAPIIDIETPKGFLVFTINIDKILMNAARAALVSGSDKGSAKKMKTSKHMAKMANELKTQSDGFQSSILWMLSLILFFSLVVVGLVIGTSARSIIKRVTESAERVQDIAEGEGDLTKRVNESGSDEVNDLSLWFNKFIANLQGIIISVKDSVSLLSVSSSQISDTSKDVREKTVKQAAQTEQVATSIAEMSQTILEVAQNSSSASNAAKESVQEAKRGNETVDKTVAGMSMIAETVKTSAITIGNLGESSRMIGEIVNVINDIADQTNLLALNAAIEAARAGEQGRGFAVVADEVRKLAERTSHATKEISEMINKIQSDTESSVNTMEEGVLRVQEGVELAEASKESLLSIVKASEQCVDMVNMIASSTEQQSTAIEEISANMESISTASNDIKHGMGQIEDSTNSLSDLSQKLKSNVDIFKV
ncbi:MAG TPA: methyl-accepting chemotaxis protein [Nitrospirae bacterium]|nr:methyl-accepting chemotaxis protein [Nitrospirota bacterium]